MFKKFFIAAQEFTTAAVAAGGIEKLKQDPKYKGISSEIIDIVYGAGKALEDLPNPDVAARRGSSSKWASIKKAALNTGKKAYQGAKKICRQGE